MNTILDDAFEDEGYVNGDRAAHRQRPFTKKRQKNKQKKQSATNLSDCSDDVTDWMPSFSRLGVAVDAQQLALDLWQPYMGRVD